MGIWGHLWSQNGPRRGEAMGHTWDLPVDLPIIGKRFTSGLVTYL